MSGLIKKMINVCEKFGSHPEWVQGGGGNVSVKLDDRVMAIKASGLAFRAITDETGFVSVNYQAIKEYYIRLNPGLKNDFEKESVDFIISQVVSGNNCRPSIEAGFHAFLGKFVIHTHSVYINALSCAMEGNELFEEICRGDFQLVWVPYANPGFNLTLAMVNAAVGLENGTKAFFLQNHGIVVSGEELESCLAAYKLINSGLKKFFKLENYPIPKIKKNNQGFESDTDWLKEFLVGCKPGYFDGVMFPDQVVYLRVCFCGEDSCDKKAHINGCQIIYHASEKESQTIEETLLAYCYILNLIEKNNLNPNYLSAADVQYIGQMESEKYRQDLLKK
ncbi:MAG: class II aldolase/adducin family protein [Patescibacteria group bacterium]